MKVPSAEPEPQWISVEERLPELDQCNLVTMQHANGDIDVVIGRLVKSYWGSDNDFVWESDNGECTWGFKNAFAWRELPEPYQSKEESE